MNNLRWGILGTGTIAQEGAKAIQFLQDATLIAVGSRSSQNANQFGDAWQIPNRHSSYESLVNDPEVDAIYIATPHPFHKENALLALRVGKPVLLEKPLTINATEAEEIINFARQNNVFLMEAMWSRFVPANQKIVELIKSGAIGDVSIVMINLTFDQPYNLEGRLYKPELAGGALLDLGVYTVSYASWLLGKPTGIQSHAFKAPTGVDQRNSLLLSYDTGATALLTSAMRSPAPAEATIIGRGGAIKVHDAFYRPHRISLHIHEQNTETIEIPYENSGYQYQFAHVQQCLTEGLTESPIMPLDESLQIMQTMDAIRAQWGLKYPMER